MPELTWKKICCPVDFTEASRAAVEIAAALTCLHGSELVLLHVDDQPAAVVGLLSAFRAEAEGRGAVRVSTANAGGSPGEAIAAYAERHGVDLLVMGMRGRPLGEAGSVSERTVRSARCPVVVVHGRAAAEA